MGVAHGYDVRRSRIRSGDASDLVQRIAHDRRPRGGEMDADLVLLAMGFTGPVKNGLLDSLGVKYDQRGAVSVDEGFMTNLDGVFAGGDTKRGASLIVWAIAEGRKMAAGINQYLSVGKSAKAGR